MSDTVNEMPTELAKEGSALMSSEGKANDTGEKRQRLDVLYCFLL